MLAQQFLGLVGNAGIAEISTHLKGVESGDRARQSPGHQSSSSSKMVRDGKSHHTSQLPLILVRVMMEPWEGAIPVGLRRGDDKDTNMVCWADTSLSALWDFLCKEYE